MMLAVLAAAAAVQSGQPAVAKPGSASVEVRTALSCPPAGKLVAKSPGVPANAFHTLDQEPDAALIKPVARNYCEPSDVVRTNVSGDTANAVRPPVRAIPPRIAR